MRIGELSAATGVTVATIRLYEREGLIPPAGRTSGQLREFDHDHVQRLRLVRQLRDIGFSMDHVRALLAASDGQIDGVTLNKINEISALAETKVLFLQKLKQTLREVIDGRVDASQLYHVIDS